MATQSGGAGVATTSTVALTLVDGDPAIYCQHERQAAYCGTCQWLANGTGPEWSPPE
jgi:hypothetical protein